MAPYEEALLLEAGIAASSLGVGLTSIRRHDFTSKGRFYSSLFALTVGLERMLKIAVVLDYILEHKVAPPNEYLKNQIGHHIDKLFSRAREICKSRHLSIDESRLDDALSEAIIDILTKFARHSRYYNLDTITGTRLPGDEEPLAEWSRRVGDVIVARHLRWTKTKQRSVALAAAMAQSGGIVVNHVSDNGIPIADPRHLALEAALIDTKQKYSVLYMHHIIVFCVALVQELDLQMRPLLFIHEVFQTFYTNDRAAVLRRKNWDPYPAT